jgi:hypothetical protein
VDRTIVAGSVRARAEVAPKESAFVSLVQEPAAALRSLIRAPRYTLPALASLALGIGAATAVLAVYSAMALRPSAFLGAAELLRRWSPSAAVVAHDLSAALGTSRGAEGARGAAGADRPLPAALPPGRANGHLHSPVPQHSLSETWRPCLPLIAGLIGQPRRLALHPGGVLLDDAPLHERVPLERRAGAARLHATPQHAGPVPRYRART